MDRNYNIEFSKLALEMAKQSFEEGAFPAGAVLVKDDKIIAKNTSTKYPKITLHPESRTIDEAMNLLNIQLTDYTLYTSMEPCLMCLSRAYWAGIRKIVYVIKKENVDTKICYEGNHNHSELVAGFNENIELVQVKELENEALILYNKWISQLA